MMKRIVAALLVSVLALGCAFALAETAATEETATEETATTETTTEETTTEETATTVEGKTRYISARKGLYIRAAADLDAEIVATPDFNYTVKVIGEEGKWSHVIYESNGKTYEGYCWTAYLSNHKIVVVKKTDEESKKNRGNGGRNYQNPFNESEWVTYDEYNRLYSEWIKDPNHNPN